MSTALVAPLVDVELTQTSWTPAGTMTFEQWQAAGEQLQLMGRAVNWWIGDWILYGEKHYGEMYSEAIDLTGLEYDTLKNIVWVAKHVDRSRRRDSLSWSHHYEVAALPAAEQDRWLAAAETEGMTRNRLRRDLQTTTGGSAQPDPAQPTHMARLTLRLAAGSDDEARSLVAELEPILARRGMTVTQTTVRGLG